MYVCIVHLFQVAMFSAQIRLTLLQDHQTPNLHYKYELKQQTQQNYYKHVWASHQRYTHRYESHQDSSCMMEDLTGRISFSA